MISPERQYGPDPKLLSAVRVLLAAVTLLAVYLDPTRPTYYAGAVYALLAAYLVYSLVVFGFGRWEGVWPGALLLHGTDLAIAAVLTLFTDGVASPFFVYFAFILLAAAWRWGLWASVATAGVAISFMLVEGLLASSLVESSPVVMAALEPNRLMTRSVYLVVLSVVVGSLAETEKYARMRSTAIAEIVTSVQRQGRLSWSIDSAFTQLLGRFGGSRIVLVAIDDSGRTHVWQSRGAAGEPDFVVESFEIAEADRQRFTIAAPYRSWLLRRSARSRTGWMLAGGSGAGDSQNRLPFVPPDDFVSAHRPEVVIGTTVHAARESVCHYLLFDPTIRLRTRQLVDFFEAIVQHVTPSIHNAYLISQLRSRARTIERLRVARELHDGIIQSLIAIQMQLDIVLDASPDPERVGLIAIQQQLANEIMDARDLMQHLAPLDVEPDQLLDVLADLVTRLERQTSIRARLVSSVNKVAASRDTCREIVRIVQEALTNVRKHSGARHVFVHLHEYGQVYRLVIEDDGRGFDFEGRLTMEDLRRTRVGPAIILDRIRSIGGELVVESAPNEGTRLEIVVPITAKQTFRRSAPRDG